MLELGEYKKLIPKPLIPVQFGMGVPFVSNPARREHFPQLMHRNYVILSDVLNWQQPDYENRILQKVCFGDGDRGSMFDGRPFTV